MAALVWVEPDNWVIRTQIQQQLKRLNRYSGPADGAWGPNTIRGIQYSCKLAGAQVTVDGIPGPETSRGVEWYATGKNLSWPVGYPMSVTLWHQFLNRLASVPNPSGGPV